MYVSHLHPVELYEIARIINSMMINELTDRERHVLMYIYLKGKTQKETSILMGISAGRVHTLNRISLRKMRYWARLYALTDYSWWEL